MATYRINFARIEHNVYTFDVEADNDKQARIAAEQYIDEHLDWDKYETVHAEEFINGITEV